MSRLNLRFTLRSIFHSARTRIIRPLSVLLFPVLAFLAGTAAAHVVHTCTVCQIVPVSSQESWGLSFREEGKAPTANATAEQLQTYDAYYADMTDEKVLYLTFDAGYENGCTPAILDALKKHQVPAAFFIVGNYLETSPGLVRRMADEGHLVANHTFHHPNMSKLTDPDDFAAELTELETMYTSVTGLEMPRYYRPPQGIYSESNLQMAKDLGYRTIFWSLAYVDWYQDDQPTKEEAFEKLLGRVHPGAIILLHSTSATNAEILDELLMEWKRMGYTFRSLDELP